MHHGSVSETEDSLQRKFSLSPAPQWHIHSCRISD